MKARLIVVFTLAACSSPEPLIVVGAGPAGLAAAIEAADERDVLVLEATERLGGSALWATGVTVLPVQPAAHPHLGRLAPLGVDWLTELGVPFGPTSAPAPRGFRALQPLGGGPQLVSVLVEKAREKGVEFKTHCAVAALSWVDGWTVDAGGCGVYRAPSVVVATGGILGDDAARQAWLGEDTPRLSPKTTAPSGLSLTVSVNAARFDEGRVLWFDHISPVGGVGRTLAAPPSTIALSASGDRIQGALRGWGPGQKGVEWAIVSGSERSRTQLFDIDRQGFVSLADHLAQGGGKEAVDVAEIAVYTGIPEEKLEAVLRRRTPRGPGPLPDGPHAVLRLQRAPAKQLGGLKTDARGRVLDASNRPIPGLYAAGELTGFHGLHAGQTPVDSTMVVGAVVTGRIAGKGATGAILE